MRSPRNRCHYQLQSAYYQVIITAHIPINDLATMAYIYRRSSCIFKTSRGSGQLYSRHFYQVGGPPPIMLTRLDISGGAGSQWCPPSVFFLKPKGLGIGGSPHQGVHSIGLNMGGIGRRGGARGEGEAEDQWWWEERGWQEAALRRSPLLKTLSGRGWDSSYCKKVKVEVSLFTFNFCCVNCCNTSQLLLLTGSRLLKLLLTTKCISTRIFVCLFLFNFLLLQKTIPTSSFFLWVPKKGRLFSGPSKEANISTSENRIRPFRRVN